MVAQMGGGVEGGHHREFGRAELSITAETPLFEGFWKKGDTDTVWMSHGDRVTQLPPGFKVVGVSTGAPFAAIADEKRKLYAVQFHPEVAHTPRGGQLIGNFVRKIAGLAGDWSMAHFRSSEIAKIRAQVGKGRVICGLSGGVDSAVAAVLIHEAVGDQLTCIFVDHGLLRLDEAQAGGVAVPRPLQHSSRARGRQASGSCGAGRQDRPRGQAQDHRRAVHRRVRRGGQEARRRRVPGPGHALSRRDRERILHRRAVGDDQVAPQRRRPARAHEPQAGRAAARAVQGRGAGARARAGPAGAFRRPPSVPRARASPSAFRAK